MGINNAFSSTARPTISFPGYGILFFHQLGILKYLQATSFDLSACDMTGSSAGSMLSALAACNTPPQAALDLAHQLCLKHGVFERPLGLMGVWGGIVREWLDLLLPADAADRCSGRVRIVITTLPFFQREAVTNFEGRDDLINCCLASSHVPFLMDWQASALYRGRRCVDGSLLYILTGKCHHLKPLTQLSSLLLFDPFSDRQLLQSWNILRCVLLCGKDGAQRLLDQGFTHAAALHKAGALDVLLSPSKTTTPGVLQPAEDLQEQLHVAAAESPASQCDISLFGSEGSSSSSNSGFFADAVAVIAECPDVDK